MGKTHHGVAPDFEVQTALEELDRVPGLGLSVTAVLVDAVDDELGLALRQELPRCVGLVGEVDQEPVCDDAEEAGQGAFDDEDPGCR